MRSIFFLFLIILISSKSIAQKETVIQYRYRITPDFYKDSFCINITASGVPTISETSRIYKSKFLSFSKKDEQGISTVAYSIPDTSISIFQLGFGHEIITLPKDSITILIDSAIIDKIGSLPSPWMNKFEYYGKNKFIYSLFDSLAYVGGELRFNLISYRNANYNLDTFYEKVTDLYKRRNQFLDTYCTRYFIPKTIKELVQSEINSSYIGNLFVPFNINKTLSSNDLPTAYRQTLNEAKFNDKTLYQNTNLYKNASYGLALFHSCGGKLDSIYAISGKGMIAVYQTIKQLYTGEIQTDLLAYHLENYLQSPTIFPLYDSVLADFFTICTDKSYNKELDSLYRNKLADNNKRLKLSDAFNSSLISYKETKWSSFDNIIKNKLTLIACWASWCAPCIAEIPHENQLKTKFGNKIDIIYLSFDQNLNSWKNKIQKLNIVNNLNYCLQNNFRSPFAKFFHISSIPYYILIGKDGKIISADAPRPSDKALQELVEKNL